MNEKITELNGFSMLSTTSWALRRVDLALQHRGRLAGGVARQVHLRQDAQGAFAPGVHLTRHGNTELCLQKHEKTHEKTLGTIIFQWENHRKTIEIHRFFMRNGPKRSQIEALDESSEVSVRCLARQRQGVGRGQILVRRRHRQDEAVPSRFSSRSKGLTPQL